MMDWGTFRTQIREGVLNDNPSDVTKRRWSDTQLQIYVSWALNAFCAHTAMATATTIIGVTGTEVQLPPNVYESIERAGLVSVIYTGQTPQYLDPVNYTRGLDPNDEGNYYYIFPDNQLNLSFTPSSALSATIRYFAYYNAPYADSDIITAPDWGFPAISYLVAAHAMSASAVRISQIRQFSESPDTGNPEHNPFTYQQQQFIKMYEIELMRHPRQVRENFFRRI
jgi:hypothetical protein